MELNRISLRGASLGRVPLPRISLEGRTGGEPAQDFEGYPLELSVSRSKVMKDYTIYGNTDANARGVGRELVQGVVDNLADIVSRGITFGITNGKIHAHGTRTEAGEIVNKCGEVKAGHKYIFSKLGFWTSEINLQVYATGHDIIYLEFEEKTFTAPADMSIYLQVLKGYSVGREVNISEMARPFIFDLTEIGWEDINTADELAIRLGCKNKYELPAFPYGSSFVAPIRVANPRAKVDLGGLTWVLYQTAQGTLFRGIIYGIKKSPSSSYLPSIFVKGYHTTTQNNRDEKSISQSVNSYSVDIIDSSFADAAAFKAAMSGVMLDYELETPETLATYPSVLSSPLHKIGDIVDYKESNGKEWHGLKFDELTNGTIRSASASNGLYVVKIPSMINNRYDGVFVPPKVVCTDSEFVITGQNSWPTYPKCITGYNSDDNSLLVRIEGKTSVADFIEAIRGIGIVFPLATPTEVQGEPLPRLAIPKGESIVTLDTEVEPSNITAKI